MNALISPKSSASVVSSKRKRVGPILAAATVVGAQLLLGAGVIAAPPAPELDYAIADGTSDSVWMYIQWYTSNYSDPSSVYMTFYWGDNSTTLGPSAQAVGDNCTASETSQTIYDPFSDSYNPSANYEGGVQAYDDSGYSDISWIGATNE